ncbi:alpha/beta hydrolase [Thalassospiraceae bacterium LMO-JJ14]|nr:alpha/beta hydrolase [Thalassospiraceae bacterium LMO-JJ14]
MTRIIVIFCAVLVLFARPAHAADCDADNLTRVRVADECLVIATYGADAGAKTMIVFIHGDGSRGGPSDYLAKTAYRYGKDGAVAVNLIRPGYFDSYSNKSTGTSYRREGDGYRPKIVAAVAGAVEALKAFHGVSRVVLVGHSGGAAISGIILGRFPGLADAAVLAACPCHVPDWRVMRRGRNNWTLSQSPHEFADNVPQTARVIAVTGSHDSNTFPVIASDYIESLKKRGIDASFVDSPGASHNGVTGTDEFYAAIDALLK